jgi:hypothetical protein
MNIPIIDNYINNNTNNDYVRRFSFSVPEEANNILTNDITTNNNLDNKDLIETNISMNELENLDLIKIMRIIPLTPNNNKIKYKIPTEKANDVREIWMQAKIAEEETAYNIEIKLICWAFDFAIANVDKRKITKITWITSSGCKCDSTWKAFLNWIICASTSTNPVVNSPQIVVNLPSSKSV